MTGAFACLVTASTFRRKTSFPVRGFGHTHATAPPRRRGGSAPTARYDLSQKRRCVCLLHRRSKTQPYRLLHVTAVLGRSGPGNGSRSSDAVACWFPGQSGLLWIRRASATHCEVVSPGEIS